MDRDRVDSWLEKGILWLVLLVLVFAPLATGAVRLVDFLIVEGLILTAALLWIFRLVVAPKVRLLWPPLCWVVCLWVLYSGFAYANAEVEALARVDLIRSWIYALWFFLLLQNLHRQESVRLISMTVLGVGVFIACYALYQFITKSDRIWTFVQPIDYKGRAGGSFICPNHLAGFLELIIPVGLAYMVAGRFNHVAKIVIGYGTLLLLAGLAVSLSRAGWLSVAISFVVFTGLLLRESEYRIQAIVLGVLALGGSAFLLSNQFSMATRLEKERKYPRSEIRYQLWEPALKLWQQSPWTGVGPNHYDFRFRQIRPPYVQAKPDRVHNDYLNTLTDWGLVGLGLVMSALVALVWGIVRSWRFVKRSHSIKARHSNKFAFLLGSSVGLSALAVHSFFDYNMHIPSTALLAITWMALLSAHLRFATEDYWISCRWLGRSLTCVGVASAFLFLTHNAWKQGRVEHGRRIAYSETTEWDEKIEALKRSTEIDPKQFQVWYDLGEAIRQSLQEAPHAVDLKERRDQARVAYETALRLNPYFSYAAMQLGLLHDQTGDHEQAEAAFARAEKLDPNHHWVLAQVGWHEMLMKRFDSAEAYLLKSTAIYWTRRAERMLIVAKEAARDDDQRYIESLIEKVPSRNP